MKKIRSQIVPIARKDIDTDMIIPADYLKGTGKTGLRAHLFARLREAEKDFPLNLEKYSSGQILVARKNFGCGSSREHAAWALADWGFRVVIAPSFADIFFKNAVNNGVLPLRLGEESIERMFSEEKASDSYIVEVDLVTQNLTLPDGVQLGFHIDSFTKEKLISGMDDLDYLAARMLAIRRFDAAHRARLFFRTDEL